MGILYLLNNRFILQIEVKTQRTADVQIKVFMQRRILSEYLSFFYVIGGFLYVKRGIT